MKANTIRSFAGGLIVAASVCGAVYFFGSSEAATTQAKEKLTVDEMISALASEGYVIQTEEQWQEQLAAAEQRVEEEAEEPEAVEEEPKEVEEPEVKEIVIYRTMLTVSPGMTSIDIGQALVRAEIIDNAMNFYNTVEKRGLANQLRPGTFEVDSEMSMDEIISIIFKQ
jgi:FtsZ-interacting cell division protein ZipA